MLDVFYGFVTLLGIDWDSKGCVVAWR